MRGANNAAASEFDLQSRYDIAYTQCMCSAEVTSMITSIAGSTTNQSLLRRVCDPDRIRSIGTRDWTTVNV
jgi:hypothetical protein